MTEYFELHIGRRETSVTVRTDFDGMWRVHHGDRVSDMVNLSRAKDAAITWARPRGLGSGEVARWHRRETPLETCYGVFSPGMGESAPEVRSSPQ